MPFQPKGTISRVTFKPRKAPSPFSAARRKKPGTGQRKATKAGASSEDAILREVGQEDPQVLRERLAPGLNGTSVEDVLRYAPNKMFADVPDRSPGMNSTRIAEVLNFRIRLPPAVSVAQVHAILSSPTATEREIASLVHRGVAKKVFIPGRGSGSSAVGDVLVLVSEWERIVRSSGNLPEPLKEKYISHLKGEADAPTFTMDEIKQLVQTGLLTGSSMLPSVSETFLRPGSLSVGSLKYVASSGAKNASGSDAAVASSSTDHLVGGSRATERIRGVTAPTFLSSYSFTLPNFGPYLRLIKDSREQLVTYLEKTGPHKSTSLDRLKELWDGGAANIDSEAAHERRGLLPGRTKKWRDFYGLQFEFVLAECIGSGLVECFRTGSIGTGVRAL